jgi:CRP-like cAMP-binding protein
MQKALQAFSAHPIDPHKLIAKTGIGRATEDYRNNQTVFVQGEVAGSAFFIQKGRVKLTVTSEHGKEAVVAILDEGQFFGEGCLHDQPVRSATAIAFDDCRITSITKAAMQSAIRDQPKFANLFMEHLLRRNTRIQEDVIDQLFNSSEKRLARLLLLLANCGKQGNPPIVPVALSQGTLADMIGTTRSRVSFFTNKFRELGFIDYNVGFIEYNSKVDVHQSLLDSILHDKPEIRQDDTIAAE